MTTQMKFKEVMLECKSALMDYQTVVKEHETALMEYQTVLRKYDLYKRHFYGLNS